MSATTDCPCGSKKPFTACCEPYITGKASAPTAEALMRALYKIYATGKRHFIEKARARERRADLHRNPPEKCAKHIA